MRRMAILALVGLTGIPGAIQAVDWKPITTQLLAREKPGFGGLAGVVIDHATGQLFVQLSDRGVFTSKDRGKSWRRFGEGAFKGRTEVPGCFLIDPTGKTKRLMLPLVYGAPTSFGDIEKKAGWRTANTASRHVDWCAADWTDPAMKFLLTLKHESGGEMLLSRNGGKQFESLGKGFGPAWIFDSKTAVAARLKTKDQPKGGLVRTVDGGKTWQPAGRFTPLPVTLPRWHDGTLYWFADDALYATTDKAATWKKLSELKGARFGPVFGKKAGHLFALTNRAIHESKDGGVSWGPPIAAPKGLKGINNLVWLDFDPISNTLYMMMMGSELYACQR